MKHASRPLRGRLSRFYSPSALVIGMVLVIATMWSWLFMSGVARLANSYIVGYLMALLGFSVIVSLSSLISYYTLRYFWRKDSPTDKPTVLFLIQLYFGWAFVEFVIAHVVSMVWMGHNGRFDTVLPFTSFAPLLGHTPLRFLSRFVGYYGLSAIVVLSLWAVCSRRYRRYVPAIFAGIFLLNLIAWRVYAKVDGTTFTATILAEAPPDRVITIDQPTDVVIVPEYGFDLLAPVDLRFPKTAENSTFFVGSQHEDSSVGRKNVLVFGNNAQGVLEHRAKSRLIPGGEYLPYVAEELLRTTGGTKTLEFFFGEKAVVRGPDNYQPLATTPGVRLGSGVCASIIAADDYRHYTQSGATVLTNSASLGIFQSPIFTFQHHGLAMFMATANARPFLQSSNDAPAFALDHNGNFIAKISPTNQARVNVSANTKTTPYTRLGEWPVYIGGLLALVTGIRFILNWKIPTQRTKKSHKPTSHPSVK